VTSLGWVQGAGSNAAAATLTIPGFTHPVRDLFLEDVLEATGFAVSRGSRWAKRGTPQAGIQVTASASVGGLPCASSQGLIGQPVGGRATGLASTCTVIRHAAVACRYQ